jgi:uncharacterized protein
MSDTTAVLGYRRTPLPLTRVAITDPFWSPRQQLIRTHTLRQQEQMLHRNGQFQALALTWKPGDANPPHIFWESDVAKWIEAASYCLAVTDDPDLDRAVDQAIELLAGAQQRDGYLNVYFTVVKPGERFTDLRDAHELYCAGHLIEAGVAHHQATGKTTLLEIVRRYADLIDHTFGPGGRCEGGYDGHQEIELALVKLYRATGERRYLELSRRMIVARGRQPFYFEVEAARRGTAGYFGAVFPDRDRRPQRFREYNQSHLPVTEQTEIVGHAVRAMYMMSAVTDLAAEYDDEALRAAAIRLWNDLTARKLYITGGLGSNPAIEGFGSAYDLPDQHGYAETCAAIGLVQWAQRMSNSTGHGRYVDTLERALYNGVLSGASADGTHYFYGNPLASQGDVHRHEWFGVACCPPNLARLISELGHYIYAQGDHEAVINLFVAGSARFQFSDQMVTVEQRTDYPRTGRIRITVHPETPGARFAVSIRIPGWARHTALLNGEPLTDPVTDGYLRLDRAWTPGDDLDLDLDLRPHRTWAHSSVASAAGKVAIERGPVVFCLEGIDHAEPVACLALSRDAPLVDRPDDRTGLVMVHAEAVVDVPDTDGETLYKTTPPAVVPRTVTAVPYFSWANRGQADMTVWIRESVSRHGRERT